MTRFWIAMADAIGLVEHALENMAGGETYIPKLPACTLDTLADVIAPDKPREYIGVRPGEKMHETLVSAHEARRTYDCGANLVIVPEFDHLAEREKPGERLPDGFSYESSLPELQIDDKTLEKIIEEDT